MKYSRFLKLKTRMSNEEILIYSNRKKDHSEKPFVHLPSILVNIHITDEEIGNIGFNHFSFVNLINIEVVSQP